MGNKHRHRGVLAVMITTTRATAEQLRARLELRRSSAASPHRNRKRFHKADRRSWKKDW